MDQSEFWDAVALAKTFSHPFDLRRFAALVAPSARTLDYGCGYGRICAELKAAGYHDVLGVDRSPRMIARARDEHPGVAFDVIDGALPMADASFDAVVLFSVLTCIPEDAGQRALVGELARVLRPGGLIYASDLLLQDDERNRTRYDAYSRDAPYGVFQLEPGVVFRHLARPWVDELFGPFEGLEFIAVDVVTMNGHPARAFQYFGRR